MRGLCLWAPSEADALAAASQALPETLDGGAWGIRAPDTRPGHPRTADGAVRLDVDGIRPWDAPPVFDADGKVIIEGVPAPGFHFNLIHEPAGEARARAFVAALGTRGGMALEPATPDRVFAA